MILEFSCPGGAREPISPTQLFSFHLNTYVPIMGLRTLYILIFFSAGIDFRRQNMTSKVGSRAERRTSVINNT